MSPAAIPEEMQPDQQSDANSDPLQAVGKAFDALLLTIYRLTNRHNDLKQHAEEMFQQYTNVTRQLAPQDKPHAMEVQQRLLDQQKELSLGLVHNKSRIEEQSLNSMDVIKTLVSHQNVDENATRAIVAGVKGYKALLRTQDNLSQISSNCILARGPDPSVCLEQDFTTNGTQGSLHCPFSKPKMSQNPADGSDAPKIQVDTCGNDLDPIKADQEERRSSTTPSARTRTSSGQCPVSRCPIRYMDKHSPEEIAEPADMRLLDAKYGGLANMINGLSVKHQAFLPNRQTDGDDQGSTSASTQRVEQWAENVHPANPGPSPPTETEDDENRKGHFDRPLREVRVGESPSRPWGIPVPITQQADASALPGSPPAPMSPESHPAPPDKVADVPKNPAGRCPFGHGASNPAPKPEEAAIPPKPDAPWPGWAQKDIDNAMKPNISQADPAKSERTSQPANVIFSGPVFFGYSAEETARFMQQLQDWGKS
ncbi:hypothetical protein N7470_006961 [Penicillium chermesinum]|nr:hypothetical protein N7470_006961 [Penicillium chermesinum]